MVQAGYENWYLPVDMIHYKGESTKKDSMQYVRVFYNAMLIFYRKHFPRFRVVVYPFIKLGVWVRQSLAMAKRLLKRVFCLKSKGDDTTPWVILSNRAASVAAQVGIPHYASEIPATGKARVLIDNKCYTYSQIVATIARESRKGLAFHIFSDENQLIISPKMQ